MRTSQIIRFVVFGAAALFALHIFISQFRLNLRRDFIWTVYRTKWAQYQALTKLLALGMNPKDVINILGKPSVVDHFSVGERWIYDEDQPTSDWTYIVEFERQPGSTNLLALCYVLNMEDRIIPNTSRSEMGKMLELTEPGGSVLLGDPTYQPKTAN